MKEVNPAETKRTKAFTLWKDAPMPMVTLFKTIDVTNLVKLARRGIKHGFKFNMLLCWCIGRAAARMEEFYLLPAGNKLFRFDKIAVNVVVATDDGGIETCDIPFSDDFAQFARDYDELTARVAQTGQAHELGGEYMVIGTSALAKYDIDGAVNIYAGIYNNPFLIWGKYRKRFYRARLPLSFQFHHAQMDGNDAAEFLERLQREIDALKPNRRANRR